MSSAHFTERRIRMRDIQRVAATALARAIRHGLLARPASFPCADCGGAADRYDHRDYTQPLKVDACCRRCNALRGKADVWAAEFHPNDAAPS
jgi:hypothetical protein